MHLGLSSQTARDVVATEQLISIRRWSRRNASINGDGDEGPARLPLEARTRPNIIKAA